MAGIHFYPDDSQLPKEENYTARILFGISADQKLTIEHKDIK